MVDWGTYGGTGSMHYLCGGQGRLGRKWKCQGSSALSVGMKERREVAGMERKETWIGEEKEETCGGGKMGRDKWVNGSVIDNGGCASA